MSGLLSILWKVFKWIGLGGGLALLGISALTDPADIPSSTWNGPVFVQDHWKLTGIVDHGVQTHRLFEQELDLVEVRLVMAAFGHWLELPDRMGVRIAGS